MPRKGSATTWPRHLDEAAAGGKRLKLTTRADSNHAVPRACGLVQVLQQRPEEAGLDVVPGGLFYGPAHIRVGDTATRLGGADQPTPVSVVVWPGGSVNLAARERPASAISGRVGSAPAAWRTDGDECSRSDTADPSQFAT